MKAYSKGLEVGIELTHDELDRLEHKHLDGILNFVDNDDNSRDIPMSICIGFAQRELLAVRQYPFNDYFGRSREVMFLINDEFYESLKRQGSYGDRFYGSEGKLVVEVVEGTIIPEIVSKPEYSMTGKPLVDKIRSSFSGKTEMAKTMLAYADVIDQPDLTVGPHLYKMFPDQKKEIELLIETGVMHLTGYSTPKEFVEMMGEDYLRSFKE